MPLPIGCGTHLAHFAASQAQESPGDCPRDVQGHYSARSRLWSRSRFSTRAAASGGVPGQLGLVEILTAGVFEEVGLRDRSSWPGCAWGLRRGAGWGVLPEAAVFEDLVDDLALPSFDKGDDLHGPTALGAEQRVGLVDAFDEHGPASSVEPHRIGNDRLVLVVPARLGGRIGLGGDLFGTHAPGLVGVVTVVADEVFALVGDVLGEFGEEVQGLKDLEVTGDASEQVVPGGVGEAVWFVLVGVVDNLTGAGDADQAGETERAASHVLAEAFEAIAVGVGQADGAIDAEPGMPPGTDLGDEFRFDTASVEQQAQDVVLPDSEEWFVGEVRGDGMESTVGRERAVGDHAVDVGMEVHERAKGLDGQNAAGGGVVAKQATVGLEDGLPGEARQFVEQIAVVAEEDAQAFGDSPDELAMRHVEADIFGDVHTEQERALLGATRADAALLAGESDEELVVAVGAADASEAVLEVAAPEKVTDGLVIDRSPVAELSA